jgi:hypothetical protein
MVRPITPLPASALIAGLRILGVEEGLPRLPDLEFAIYEKAPPDKAAAGWRAHPVPHSLGARPSLTRLICSRKIRPNMAICSGRCEVLQGMHSDRPLTFLRLEIIGLAPAVLVFPQ